MPGDPHPYDPHQKDAWHGLLIVLGFIVFAIIVIVISEVMK